MLPAMVLLLMVAPPEAPKFTEAAQKELKKLEGKWKVVEVSVNGTTSKAEEGDEDFVFTFKGSRMKAMIGKKLFQEVEVVAIDPKSDPKCIDTGSLDPKHAGLTQEAIYTIEGDTLRMCSYKGRDKNRPTTFDPPSDSDTQLVILKRVKE